MGELHRSVRERRSKASTSTPSASSATGTELGAGPAEEQQGAVVGRLLDDHPVAGLDHVAEEQRRRLHRAVGHHHLTRRRCRGTRSRSTRRGPGGRSRCRRTAPAASPRRARSRAASRTASFGRMSALGAPRAKLITSTAIGFEAIEWPTPRSAGLRSLRALRRGSCRATSSSPRGSSSGTARRARTSDSKVTSLAGIPKLPSCPPSPATTCIARRGRGCWRRGSRARDRRRERRRLGPGRPRDRDEALDRRREARVAALAGLRGERRHPAETIAPAEVPPMPIRFGSICSRFLLARSWGPPPGRRDRPPSAAS